MIEQLLKADLILIDEIGFAPMDDNGAQLFFRSSLRPMNAALSASARTGPSKTGVASSPSTPRPSACSTDSSTTASSWPPPGESFRLKEARQKGGGPSSRRVRNHREGCVLLVAKTAEWKPATDRRSTSVGPREGTLEDRLA